MGCGFGQIIRYKFDGFVKKINLHIFCSGKNSALDKLITVLSFTKDYKPDYLKTTSRYSIFGPWICQNEKSYPYQVIALLRQHVLIFLARYSSC